MRHFSRAVFLFYVFCALAAAVLLTQQDEVFAAPKSEKVSAAERAEAERINKEQRANEDFAKTKGKEISDYLWREGCGWWGPGGYFSPTKLSLYIILFLTWVRCASWVNADQERLKREGREAFNMIYAALFAGIGTFVFFVPIFWAAFPMMLLLCFAPFLMYVSMRNKVVPVGGEVLTPDHISYLMKVFLNKIGFKFKYRPRLAYQEGPAIELEPLGQGIDSKVLKARLILSRNDPGYNLLREHVLDAIRSRAAFVMFDFTPERTTVRHQVDGTWLDMPPFPRTPDKTSNKDVFEEMLEAAKKLVGGKPEDRRSRQSGKFCALIGRGKKKQKYNLEFLSQGTKTGEALMLQIAAQKTPFNTLGELGMRPELEKKALTYINGETGLFIVAAPPAHGLRSSISVFSRICDRFTRDVVNVEDVVNAAEPIENIVLAKYDSSKGETPMTVLPDVVFKEPKVIFVQDILQKETLKFCCDEIKDNGRLVWTMLRAKDGIEAVLRLLSVNVPPTDVVPIITGVVCQRLIRKLCPDCKEPYQPPPQLLQQLGLRPNQVREFYRKRTPLPENEERKRGICPTCHGIGYRGRTALFELIEMTDSIRAALLSNPNPGAIRQQIKQEGQTSFMHEGIFLLLKGEIAVEELSRVMQM
jgi:type II secretory ATPase GspE/PulE/Tfp pilus assembly ATPase PilB-like protein